jgi:2-oxoglutarate ferredoxin oxidoreductase subunit delta
MPKIVIDQDRCKGCERCTQACPQEILGMTTQLNAKGYAFAKMLDAGRCIGCRLCAISCPDVAIEVWVEGAQIEFFTY